MNSLCKYILSGIIGFYPCIGMTQDVCEQAKVFPIQKGDAALCEGFLFTKKAEEKLNREIEDKKALEQKIAQQEQIIDLQIRKGKLIQKNRDICEEYAEDLEKTCEGRIWLDRAQDVALGALIGVALVFFFGQPKN